MEVQHYKSKKIGNEYLKEHYLTNSLLLFPLSVPFVFAYLVIISLIYLM